jgi:hypothetical protein
LSTRADPHRGTPEEAHLADQLRILVSETDALTAAEAQFAADERDFHAFRASYLGRFVPLFQELDEALGGKHGRSSIAAEGDAFEDQTGAAPDATGGITPTEHMPTVDQSPPAYTPRSDRLRDLYRRLAKLVHPDLLDSTAPSEERARRSYVMTRASEAYAEGNIELLQVLLDEELARPEAISGNDTGSVLVRTIRQIAQIRRRLAELAQARDELEADPVWRVFRQVQDARKAGRDLLAELERELRQDIQRALATQT